MSLTIAATAATLTRYLTENPDEMAKSFARKEKLCDVAIVISGLAATILFFGAPIIASVLLGETYFVLKTAGLVLLAGVCFEGVSAFEERGTVACYQKVLYQLIAAETRQLKQSGEQSVLQAFKNNGRTIEQIPPATQEVLAKMHLTNRWDTFIPLIARIQAVNNKAKKKMLADQQMYKLRPAFLDNYCNNQKKECGSFLGFA